MEQQTKKCPYCGEEILAVARKCKHCGEWLDRKEQKPCPVCGELTDSDASVCPHCKEPITTIPVNRPVRSDAEEKLPQDVPLYYCKTCKAKLNINAETCPQCGDKDPFLFVQQKNGNTAATALGCAPFVAIIAIPIWLSTFSTTVTIIAFCIAALLWVLTILGLRVGSKGFTKNNSEKIKSIYWKYNDQDNYYRWRKDMNDRRGFFTTLFGFYKYDD